MKKSCIMFVFCFFSFVHFINAQSPKEQLQKKMEMSSDAKDKAMLLQAIKKIEAEEKAQEDLEVKEAEKAISNNKMSGKQKLFFDAKNNGWSVEVQMLYDDAINEMNKMKFDSEASKNQYKAKVKKKFQKTK